MIRTVLLPVDFSDDNALILAFARGLPSIGVERVVLGHVVEVSGVEGPLIARRIDEARDRIRQDAQALAQVGLDVEVRVVTGDPVEELSGLASEGHVDAAVYGSHAKTVMNQLFAGSVSERLLRDASIPHLVVRFDLLRGMADPATLLKHFGEKVVLATDFSLAASRAFTIATEFGSALRHLFLLHAIDPTLTGDKLRLAEEGAEFQLKNLQAMCKQLGITASVQVIRDTPVHALLGATEERAVTGIVVGTRGRNAVQEMLLGSVSMTLLRQAGCPILIVP